MADRTKAAQEAEKLLVGLVGLDFSKVDQTFLPRVQAMSTTALAFAAFAISEELRLMRQAPEEK